MTKPGRPRIIESPAEMVAAPGVGGVGSGGEKAKAPPKTGERKKKKGKGSGQDGHVLHGEALDDARKEIQHATIEGVLFADVESRKRREYLIALSQTGNKTQAARLVGVHPSTPYCPAWKADEAFQAGLKQAEECAADILESEAFRRAVHGTVKPTGWYKGEAGGTVREYSDILSIFLLKGLRPDVYQERVGMEVRGALAHIDLSQLPDHLLARIAAGEHPLSVLASAVPGR